MNVADQIDEVVEQLRRIKDHEGDASARIKDQQKRIKQLESENKALRECVNELVKQRQRDRVVIAEWQDLLNRTAAQSQLGIEQVQSERIQPTSSPPFIREETQVEPNPPEFIDIVAPPSTQTPIPSSSSLNPEDQAPSSPLAVMQTQSENGSFQSDENTTLKEALRYDDDSSQDETNQMNTSFNPPLEKTTQAGSSPSRAQAHVNPGGHLTTESLLEREWHPSDFIVNQDYKPRSSETSNFSSYLLSFLTSTNAPNKDLAKAGKNWRTVETDDVQGSKRFKHYHHEPTSAIQGVVRQESPPGFWRSEFADTQEWIKEKQDLNVALREQAHSRLHEAIQNGKFLFRDKELREAAAAHKIK